MLLNVSACGKSVSKAESWAQNTSALLTQRVWGGAGEPTLSCMCPRRFRSWYLMRERTQSPHAPDSPRAPGHRCGALPSDLERPDSHGHSTYLLSAQRAQVPRASQGWLLLNIQVSAQMTLSHRGFCDVTPPSRLALCWLPCFIPPWWLALYVLLLSSKRTGVTPGSFTTVASVPISRAVPCMCRELGWYSMLDTWSILKAGESGCLQVREFSFTGFENFP